MSENAPKKDNMKKGNFSEKQKRVIALLVCAVMLILLYGNQILSSLETKVDYNTFIEQVQAGEVQKADINSSSGKVSYKLKDDYKSYYTNYPYTVDFVEMLLINNV